MIKDILGKTRGASSRRTFLQRGSASALVALPAAATVLGNSQKAEACTPAPDLLKDKEFSGRLHDVLELAGKWILQEGPSNLALVRASALADFLDDWCPTYPKWPGPWPRPRYRELVRELEGLKSVAQAFDDFCGTPPRPGFPPPGVRLDLLAHNVRAMRGHLLPIIRVPGFHPC